VLERGLALAERRRLQRLSARLQVHRIELLLPRGHGQGLGHAADLAEALDLDGLHARYEHVDRRVADAAWLAAWRLRALRSTGACAHADAADALGARIETWVEEGSTLQAIDGLLLLAQHACQKADEKSAQRAVDRALAIAVPAHVLLPFIELGPGMEEVFEAAMSRSGGRGAPNLRARFLAAVQDSLRRQAEPAAPRHPQGLSPREAEIARLLAQGYSNKLIGRELQLSEGTVKFHLRNLYAKLGAHSRQDALRRLG
jgi:LuxR family maltose regulon positive regulatory protein